MISRGVLLYRLYIVINIAIIWVLFSIIFLYNIIEVDKEVLKERSLAVFSLAFAIIGLIVAGTEAFFLKHMFRKYPIWISTILRMTVTFVLFLRFPDRLQPPDLEIVYQPFPLSHLQLGSLYTH